jgi:hypothetical protein
VAFPTNEMTFRIENKKSHILNSRIKSQSFVVHCPVGWIPDFAIRNFAKCWRNFAKFRTLAELRDISYSSEIQYRNRKISNSHKLSYSIEHIKLKLLQYFSVSCRRISQYEKKTFCNIYRKSDDTPGPTDR